MILEPRPRAAAGGGAADTGAFPGATRARELSSTTSRARLLRELKAVGGDLRALRVALTGRDRGPELAAVVAALDRDETLRRIDAAL